MPKFEIEPGKVPGLLADPIRAYLEATDKRMDEAVLSETVRRMKDVLIRDLMVPRNTRVSKESNTLYSGSCARKARLTFDGAAREPMQSRTLLKFLLGDLVELSVLALAQLAGCHIEDNNIDLTVTGQDGKLIPVHPDGRYRAEDGRNYNVEIKSMDSRSFDACLADVGPSDKWGYLTQASMEVQAWREAGYREMDTTIFIVVSTGSRQGSIAEFHMPYREDLVAGWHERRAAARQKELPMIPYHGEREKVFKRGKALEPEAFTHGEPQPRTNEKGVIYGWDVPTGRTVVPTECSYCDYRSTKCWTDAVMELSGGSPAWVIPSLPIERNVA